MAGRPPKPKALHVLQGTFRADRHGPLDAGVFPAAGATMPAELLLYPTAVKFWNDEAPRLVKLGLLTEIDGREFGRLCLVWMLIAERMAAAADDASLRAFDPALWSEARQLEERFGMNPSARAKLKTEPQKPQAKLEKFRGRR